MKKQCTKCKLEKELDNFSKHSKGKLGRHPQCNECRALYSRLKYAKGEIKKKHILIVINLEDME